MIFFLVLSILRISLVTLFSWAWLRMEKAGNKYLKSNLPTFSVLIPIRNESSNIIDLLSDLARQNYPYHLFEVIVIDDHSEDNSTCLVRELISKTNIQLSLIELRQEQVKGKKMAITKGIKVAKYQYILATDGDCRLPMDWIASYANAYNVPDPPYMVTGPVRMQADTLIMAVQSMEFSFLIGYGASSLALGMPGTCNGANLSYKKEIFKAVNGYEGNENIPSGDDEFLMLKIHRAYPGKVRFLKDQQAIVATPAKDSWSGLVNQRIRWSSKWKFHKSYYITSSAIVFFTDYFLLLGAISCMVLGIWSSGIILITILLRWWADYFYIYLISTFLGSKRSLYHFLIMQIIYPIFVIFLGIASIFGSYQWKGRAYS